MRNHAMTDREAYPAAWVLVGTLALAYLVWRYGLGMPTVSRCWVWEHWGVYCPGCGGTRAVICLLHGDILRSLLYHPFVLYGTVIYSFFMVSNILYSLSISKRRYALRPIHFWAAAAIILIQCLLKNIYFDEWVRMTT